MFRGGFRSVGRMEEGSAGSRPQQRAEVTVSCDCRVVTRPGRPFSRLTARSTWYRCSRSRCPHLTRGSFHQVLSSPIPPRAAAACGDARPRSGRAWYSRQAAQRYFSGHEGCGSEEAARQAVLIASGWCAVPLARAHLPAEPDAPGSQSRLRAGDRASVSVGPCRVSTPSVPA